jgi:uncharacterized protein YidB (DUF937 family)
MEFAQLAMQLTKQFITDTNNDGQIDITETLSSITKLLSGGDSSAANLDLGGLISKLQGSGMTDLAASWLGDGDNIPISGQQVSDVLGAEKVNDFAAALNIDSASAQGALANLLPQLIDKSSSGGQLNDLLGAVGGLSGIASGLGRLFGNKS